MTNSRIQQRTRRRQHGVRHQGPAAEVRSASPHRHHWLIRPDDLLVFDVEWVNLELEPGEPGEDGQEGEPARLHRAHPGDAFLIVTLPPQHITEIAYFTTAPELQPKQTLSAQFAQQIANLAAAEASTEEPTPSSPLLLDLTKVAEALGALLLKDPSSDEPLDDPPIKAIIAGWLRGSRSRSPTTCCRSTGRARGSSRRSGTSSSTLPPPPCRADRPFASSGRTSTSRPGRSSSRPRR